MKHLAHALQGVMNDVGNVQPTGKNQHFGYTYLSEGDLLNALRPAVVKHGLVLLPVGVEQKVSTWAPTGKGKPQWVTDVKVTYRLVHAESGESVDLVMHGSGIDSEDKGLYKALTGCLKYLVRQLLLIPTGDDPDHAPQQRQRQQERPQREQEQRREWPPPEEPPDGNSGIEPEKCQKCGGALWDNRDDKRNPRQPDFKCKNRQCDWAWWYPDDHPRSTKQ